MSELKVAVMTNTGQNMGAAVGMNAGVCQTGFIAANSTCLSREILPAERSRCRRFPSWGIGICHFSGFFSIAIVFNGMTVRYQNFIDRFG